MPALNFIAHPTAAPTRVLVAPTGSNFMFPNPNGADNDYVVFIPDHLCLGDAVTQLLDDGWDLCGNNNYNDLARCALRKGDDNLILVTDFQQYLQWLGATALCAALPGTQHDKTLRQGLFMAMRGECDTERLTALARELDSRRSNAIRTTVYTPALALLDGRALTAGLYKLAEESREEVEE